MVGFLEESSQSFKILASSQTSPAYKLHYMLKSPGKSLLAQYFVSIYSSFGLPEI